MFGTSPRASALGPAPRLRLTRTRATRAVLDGAWWPRSWDASAELSGLIPALSERYGAIRDVILNGSAWTGRVRKLAVADRVVRIGWFSSMSAALLVATTEGGDQVDLVVVPPSAAQDAAERAMAGAADPANVEHAPELLARTDGPAARAEPTAGVAEAVWDDEGGSAGPGGADLTDPPAAPSSGAR